MTGNSIAELRAGVATLFDQPDLRKKYSKNIREMALDLFAHDKIKAQWKEFLKV
jgi:hypothetical protein